VFVHIWHPPTNYPDHQGAELINIFREIAFHSCTIYFVFISGFLFYYLSLNLVFKKYYKSKLYNIVCPYLFLSCCLIIVNYIYLVAIHDTEINFSLGNVMKLLLLGKAQDQYWYIPFISLVFLISPLLLQIPKKVFQRITLIGCFLPLLGSRTGTELSIGQYVYFFPTYLLGMYMAMDYSNIIFLLKKKLLLMISLALVSTAALIYLHGMAFYVGWINISESLFYIQKISICFLCIVAMKKMESKKIILLNYFATYSFAIYFTHTLVEFGAVRSWYYNQVFLRAPSLLIPLSIFYVIAIAFLNLSACLIAKKIFGKYSRYIIGV